MQFSGMEVVDTGVTTLISRPFEVFVNATGVAISDGKGNTSIIPLADTSFGTVDDLVDFLSSCQCGGPLREFFDDFNGTSLSVTINGGVLPDNTAKVFVEYNGRVLREGGSRDYTITPATGTVDFNFTARGQVTIRWFV